MDDTALNSQLGAARSAPAIDGDPRPGTRDLSDTALGALGIELVTCSPDCVVARMPVATASGVGALLVLAETAASTAAGLSAGPSRRAFGAELDAGLLDAPAAGIAIAIATPLRRAADRHTWRITVHDAHDVLVLEGRCTLGVVDAPESP